MRIEISSKQDLDAFNAGLAFTSLSAVEEGGLREKAWTNSEGVTEVKEMNGRPQLRTPLKAVRLGENGEAVGEEFGVTLALLSQPKGGLRPFEFYKLRGPVVVTHYVGNNGRMGVSIVAEGLEGGERNE